MKKCIYLTALIVFGTLFFVSCEPDDPEVEQKVQVSHGVIITNEGAFGAANASISYIDLDSNQYALDVFQNLNRRSLGDVLQSACIEDTTLYLVLNGSSKIEVANAVSFKEIATIEALNLPRYATVYNDKLYVSQWDSTGAVKVFGLDDYKEEKRIEVGAGPESILEVNGSIWVANGGAYGLDSTISVIDPSNNSVIETIVVGHNPKEMVLDHKGDIWVVCYGYAEYDWYTYELIRGTPAKLVHLTSTYDVVEEVLISETSHPAHIDINPAMDSVYVGGGFGFNGIFKVSVENPAIGTAHMSGSFYGFNVNPDNGDVFGLLAPNFTEGGAVEIYHSNGGLKASAGAGIGPNGALFINK